jgi:hypothetical protein
MTNAEQQAYEVMLDYWILRALKYEHLSHVLIGNVESIETLTLIGREELISEEVDRARQYFERVTKEAA